MLLKSLGLLDLQTQLLFLRSRSLFNGHDLMVLVVSGEDAVNAQQSLVV